MGLCVFLAGIAAARGQGAPGVTEKEIVIGSCAALEGPSSVLGRETVNGAQAYFHLVNEKGGVHGRKLRLVSQDDSYDPAKAQACWDWLMAKKVFALGFFVGTPTAAKYAPHAESSEVPLVGLFTGAQTLYMPLRHWVINVRALFPRDTGANRGPVEHIALPQDRCDLPA
jgi:ABC-type branched-subunit amino acid transport system substrate-binding protein